MKCRIVMGIMMILLILAGCNFSTDTDEQPTLPPTPVVLVNTPVPTLTPTVEFTTTPTTPPTFTPPPTVPPATTVNTATFTPWPGATNTPPAVINTPTITPTMSIPVQIVSTAAPPTQAPATSVPLPTSVPMAQVCETCGQLRLRQAPGTAGSVVTYLAANTALNVIGRTADSAWIQVALGDGSSGWVASQYLVVNVDLNGISVTGVAEDSVIPSGGGSAGGAYISGISLHARQIYLDGQAKGLKADAFAKVGDSITYSWAYLYPLTGGYNLGDYGQLASALSFFSGPNGRGENCFGASPIAAYPGWTTADVLAPGGAKTGACGPGETPLECEYRTGQPSVALIMLGTNDVAQGMAPETFRANLQRIVDISISWGVIPVLSTIPPFPTVDGSARAFNEIIIATARGNDIPLWDYYSAINGLPNRGLSPDGVHPSEAPDNKDAHFDAEHLQYGFTVRNLGTLQILYELWRQVLYDSGTLPPGPPPGPAPTAVDIGPVDPATYSCSGASPVVLTVGGRGRVTPGLPNKLRNAPGMSGTVVGSIPGEAVFNVTGGPHCSDGMSWWQVNYNGTIGWTASGTSSENWVEAVP